MMPGSCSTERMNCLIRRSFKRNCHATSCFSTRLRALILIGLFIIGCGTTGPPQPPVAGKSIVKKASLRLKGFRRAYRLHIPAVFTPDAPVPMLMMHGTADPSVPYAGAESEQHGGQIYLSVSASAAFLSSTLKILKYNGEADIDGIQIRMLSLIVSYATRMIRVNIDPQYLCDVQP